MNHPTTAVHKTALAENLILGCIAAGLFLGAQLTDILSNTDLAWRNMGKDNFLVVKLYHCLTFWSVIVSLVTIIKCLLSLRTTKNKTNASALIISTFCLLINISQMIEKSKLSE